MIRRPPISTRPDTLFPYTTLFLALVALGGFGNLGGQVDRKIRDPRLRRIFTFQALYAGVAPSRALAVYGAIDHMDTSPGVYFPSGGTRTIVESMADAFN